MTGERDELVLGVCTHGYAVECAVRSSQRTYERD